MSPFGSWGQVDNPSPTPKHRLEIPLRGRKHQSPFVGRRRLQTNKELGQQFCPFHSLSHLPINAWKKKTSSNSSYPSCNPQKAAQVSGDFIFVTHLRHLSKHEIFFSGVLKKNGSRGNPIWMPYRILHEKNWLGKKCFG